MTEAEMIERDIETIFSSIRQNMNDISNYSLILSDKEREAIRDSNQALLGELKLLIDRQGSCS